VSYKIWKNNYISYAGKSKIKKLEERILDLETKLYFCRRNKKIEDEVQKRK
jgi:hypothetical protein